MTDLVQGAAIFILGAAVIVQSITLHRLARAIRHYAHAKDPRPSGRGSGGIDRSERPGESAE